MNFLERAQHTALKGVPVIRLRPNSKAAMDDKWPELATTDVDTLTRWNQEYPDANCGAVAQARLGGYLFLELDSTDAYERIERETGQKFPATYLVRSRPGRGHFYFQQTQRSIDAGNISQSYVRQGDWSLRSNNAYVVAALSLHPHSTDPYAPLNNNPIVLIPDWLLDWCVSQKVEKTPAKGGDIPRDEKNLIPHGFIHGWLVTNAGRLRGMGLGGDLLENALLEIAHLNCAPPLNDDQIRQVARSFEKYDPNTSTGLFLNQKPDIQTLAVPVDEIEKPVFDSNAYPVFPKYVFAGTSLYENFVKPLLGYGRIDYFLWLPAMALLLNYLGTKIKLKGVGGFSLINSSIYMVLIGKPGETYKSSSINDAVAYFNYMGCAAAGEGAKTAEGRSLVWTPGSAEGLGKDAQRTNCKNIVLEYNELSTLTNKAGIDGSTLSSNLCTIYDSGRFSNTVKTSKDAYNLEPGSYVASLLAGCTDATFQDKWSRMNGKDTGLDSRMFFVFQPETLPERTTDTVNYTLALPGASTTYRHIEKAITKGEYEIENPNNPKFQSLRTLGSREGDRAKKWALAIAIDLGLDTIDDECLERGVDITMYELDVKKYLKTYSANTKEAAIQMKIRSMLERHKGRMLKRDMLRDCHADRDGTSLWNQAFKGLIQNGYIRLEGAGIKSDPTYVQLLVKIDDDND
jgi:hypothetical protein